MHEQATVWTRFACVVACIFLMHDAADSAETAPHTVEELFREPTVRGASLSPDGSLVAIAFRATEHSGDVIAVIETAKLGKPDGVTYRFSLGDNETISVQWLSWANPQRLLVGVDLWWNPSALSSHKVRFPHSSRIYAVDKDGANPVVLFSHSPHMRRASRDLASIVDRSPRDPDHVLMPAWTGTAYDLFKVNVQTGVAVAVEKGTRQTFGWQAEDGRAVLRYDINSRGTDVSIYAREEMGKDWSLLTRYARFTEKFDWSYAGDAPGAGKIYVRAAGDADKEGIYEFDLGKKAVGGLIASVPDFDMDDALLIDGKYAGATYTSDRLAYVFSEPNIQSHFEGLDAYFGRGANVHIRAIDQAQTRMLLYVSGPKAPGDFYVYDIAAKNLQFLMSARAWLDPDRLATVEAYRVKMRDGQSITSYLTWPPGKRANLPLVVLPHGGPRARDSLQFDPVAQSLAAQGWLVVQPNFRGSSGYGKTFAEAGYRQWGGLMQDDLTDTVADLVQRQLADPRRIAIFGTSYGGYAALAGAIATPTLYRAAVSRAGVTDLPKLMAWHKREDGGDSAIYSELLKRIGDPKRDAQALNKASPYRRAAEIQIPVLLIHGRLDGIVPITQSKMMHGALRKVGKDVSMMDVIGEGHGGWSSENEINAINAVIKFFGPHLNRAGSPDDSTP